MVLSNAERQKRYRERLKAAYRGDDIAVRARAVIDEALEVYWRAAQRNNWGVDDIAADLAGYKAFIADKKHWRSNGHPVEQLLECFDYEGFEDQITPDEAAVFDRARALLKAVSLRDRE